MILPPLFLSCLLLDTSISSLSVLRHSSLHCQKSPFLKPGRSLLSRRSNHTVPSITISLIRVIEPGKCLSRHWRFQERHFLPFGPFGTSGRIFPSTITGKVIKNHIKRRSQTLAVLFGVASILGVSPNSLWRHV